MHATRLPAYFLPVCMQMPDGGKVWLNAAMHILSQLMLTGISSDCA